MSKEKINYTTRPIPTGPGKQMITYDDLHAKKGGSGMDSKPPKEHLIPGGNGDGMKGGKTGKNC